MSEKIENRKFPRSVVDIAVTYSHVGSNKLLDATCINLSATGLLLKTNESIAVGTALNVNIQTDDPLALPLHALVEVKRINPVSNDEFEIAVAIEGLKGG